VREWEAGFIRFLKTERPTILSEIDKQKALDENLSARLTAAISTFNHQFGIEGYQDQPDPGAKEPVAVAPAAKESPSKKKSK
jgi:hypothetical protein